MRPPGDPLHSRHCSSELGWFYDTAHEEAQKYKEGKFILEKARIVQVRPS